MTQKSREIESQHPGSVILGWWEPAVKDEEGYAKLSELIDVLSTSTRIRGPSFLEETSKPEWGEHYGWRLELHPWQANRVRVMLPGSPGLGTKPGEVS